MKNYQDLLRKVLDTGAQKDDRTGTGTLSLFGEKLSFNLTDGFPLLTTKKVHLKSVIHELLWMLSGSTNTRYLKANGVRIWDEWANENGDLGPIYGKQWRRCPRYVETEHWHRKVNHNEDDDPTVREVYFETIDQIKSVIEGIKNEPYSRRLIVNAWNTASLEDMSLYPCHMVFQFYVINDTLSCQLYQRSADIFLGVPFNIASYSLLTMMIAQVTGLKLGQFIHVFGDVHLYLNHIDSAKIQLNRSPRALPKMTINKPVVDIDEFLYSDFVIEGYHPYPSIMAKVAV